MLAQRGTLSCSTRQHLSTGKFPRQRCQQSLQGTTSGRLASFRNACSAGGSWGRDLGRLRIVQGARASLLPAAGIITVSGAVLCVATSAILASMAKGFPKLTAADTPRNKRILAAMPSLREIYQPLGFLFNSHVETIWAALFRVGANVRYYRRCVTMPDGGVVALDFDHSLQNLPEDAPVLVLLPGLTGGSHDTYVQHMVSRARDVGIRAVVFNSRGTSDGPVTTAQFYSASFTGDTRAVMKHVEELYPNSLMLAAGWSLGANILVRYLGEEGQNCKLAGAVAMCNPLDLVMSDVNFQKGFNRFYDKRLATSLRNIFLSHEALFLERGGDLRPDLAAKCTSIREFDDAITRVVFGWPSVDAYYAGSSSADSIPHVAVPLLCLQAADDPIAPEAAIPYAAIEKNSNCILAVTPRGGHLGWVTRDNGARGGPWSDLPVIEFFTAIRAEVAAREADKSVQMVPQLDAEVALAGSLAAVVAREGNGNGAVAHA